MEPRWNSHWATRIGDKCTYIGGLTDYDLWIDKSGDLRVVRGEGSANWDWIQWREDLQRMRWGSRDMKLLDTTYEQLLEKAMLYLTLFAPWALDATKENPRTRPFKM